MLSLGIGLTSVPVLARRGPVYDPQSLFAGGKAGAMYKPWLLGTLFQDTAGTVPVASVGDPVAFISDVSGNGNHLKTLNDVNRGTLQKTTWGALYVRVPTSVGFKTVNNKPLQVPLYLAAGLQLLNSVDLPLFGVLASAVLLGVIRQHTVQNRIKADLRSAAAGIVSLTSPSDSAPLNTPLTVDSLNIAGATDIFVGGVNGSSAANTWDGVAASNAAIYGLNMSSHSAANTTMSVDFFGGVILHADPGASDRAKTVKFFQERTTRPPQPADRNILVIGDSTGDGRPGATSGPIEWPYLLAQRIAAADPTAYVEIRLYGEDVLTYGPALVVQEGTGGPAWVFYNGSVPGRTPQFVTGQHFKPLVVDVPKPSAIIWNHGHNIAATANATVTSYKGRFLGAMEQVRLQWPTVPEWVILQNPWRTSTSMTNLVAELTGVVSLYGDMPSANIHQAYLDYAPPKDSTLYQNGTDNVHPSYLGMTDVWMPLVGAMFDANWPPSNTNAAFLATKATNLLSNGKLGTWSGGVPSGWSLVGDGSVTLDATRKDGTDAQSAKVANGVTTATLLRQTLSAVALRGQNVTLAVRQFVELAAGDQTAGQIRLSSDGSGTPAVSNYAGLTSQGAGGWRWMVVSLAVPADATTITVDLQASNIAGAANGVVNYGRAVLVAGNVPRDST